MSLLASLAAGAFVGARHALETDHLAAIATLVEGEGAGEGRATLTGASWGLGHSVPVAALGLAFLVLGVRIPEVAISGLEVLVGVVLVGLGLRMLLGRSDLAGLEAHDHDGRGHHSHLRLGTISLGHSHGHVDGESFAVGLLHGFAGSGALVVLMVSTAPTLASAGAFILAFSALSIATMAVVAAVWGRTLETELTDYLTAGAGLVGVGVGLLMVVEQVPALVW